MIRVFAVVFLLAISSQVHASSSVKNIGWHDLAFEVPARLNPFYGLNLRQSQLLGILVQIERTKENGGQLSFRESMGEKLAISALESVGLDGVDLAKRVIEFGPLLQSSRRKTTDKYADRDVRISGFILPISLKGPRVTEFLLVPYAGACVHTPTPAPNQMIYVAVPEGIRVRGRFEAVTVTGSIRNRATQHEVKFSDGNAVVETAYKMAPVDVEVY